MSYRRRHRWFRRMALGLAFATVIFAGRASVAAAKFDEGTIGSRYITTGSWSGLVDMETGIPLAAGIPHGDELAIRNALDTQSMAAPAVVNDPYLTDVFVRPGESLGGPDGQSVQQASTVVPYVSHAIRGEAVKSQEVAAARPDDLANRFAHSDVASRPELASSGSTFEWNDALTIGIGAVVLALGLGLAVGYLRRPRLAGL